VRSLSPLKVGDKVYAKYRNTRYYKTDIVRITNQIFYSVDFDDGSYSEDLYPEDIEVDTL